MSVILRVTLRSCALTLAALGAAGTAAAVPAYTSLSVNLRAGPSSQYPVVQVLAPSTFVDVAGCTDGYRWCDVGLPSGLRGWVHADALVYLQGEQYVPLPQYAATIALPIIGFTLGAYWGNYYRNQSWYRDPYWWGGDRKSVV